MTRLPVYVVWVSRNGNSVIECVEAFSRIFLEKSKRRYAKWKRQLINMLSLKMCCFGSTRIFLRVSNIFFFHASNEIVVFCYFFPPLAKPTWVGLSRVLKSHDTRFFMTQNLIISTFTSVRTLNISQLFNIQTARIRLYMRFGADQEFYDSRATWSI